VELYYKNVDHILRVKPFNEFDNITDYIIEQLNGVVVEFTKQEIQSKSLHIKTLIKYNVDGNWVDKINESKKFGNDSSSLDCFITRYGENIGKQLFDEKLKNSIITEKDYIIKFGKLLGKSEWKELCKSKGNFSEQHFIDKFGKKLGRQKWQEILTKKLKTQKENFKNKKWKNGRTLEEYQERYGIEDGYNRWKLRNDKHKYRLSRDYYIDKYGKERGSIEYRLYVEQNIRNFKSTGGYSKISQRLFNQIYNKLNRKLQEKCKYATCGGEVRFFMNNDKLFLTDFKCGNKIIEYDGTYWHSFNDTQNNDKIKQSFLESKGYTVLRIPESDYLKNKQQVINKCINFINETT